MNAATPDPGRPPAAPERRGLNFWQWLGIAIIALGVIFYLYRHFATTPAPTPPEQDQNQTAPVQAQGASPAAEAGGSDVE